MTNNQYILLNSLRLILNDLNIEALVHDNFNNLLGELNIFTKSIDELVIDIENKLEEI